MGATQHPERRSPKIQQEGASSSYTSMGNGFKVNYRVKNKVNNTHFLQKKIKPFTPEEQLLSLGRVQHMTMTFPTKRTKKYHKGRRYFYSRTFYNSSRKNGTVSESNKSTLNLNAKEFLPRETKSDKKTEEFRREDPCIEKCRSVSYLYRTPKVNHRFFGVNNIDMSIEIWDFFTKNHISEEKFFKSIDVIKELYYFALNESAALKVDLFFTLTGSLASGLGMTDSNINFDVKTSSVNYIEAIELSESTLSDKEKTEETIAKWWPLADKFKRSFNVNNFIIKEDEELNIEFTLINEDSPWTISLTVGSLQSILNGKLTNLYCNLDWRFQPLYAVIRTWAMNKNLIGHVHSVLTSFSISLMLTYFLQRVDNCPVLPVVTKIINENNIYFDPTAELIFNLDNVECLSTNQMSLKELLLGFFNFYIEFNFKKYFVCTRSSKLQNREDFDENKYIYVEDPCRRVNVVKLPNSVYDKNLIINSMMAARTLILSNEPLDNILGNV